MSEMEWVTAGARKRIAEMKEDLDRALVLIDNPEEFDSYRMRLKNVYQSAMIQLADENLRDHILKERAKKKEPKP